MKHKKFSTRKCHAYSPPKTCFNTQSQARYAMMRTISHTRVNMFDLHTYQCDKCGKWHFGHKSYYESMKKTEIEVTGTVSVGVD